MGKLGPVEWMVGATGAALLVAAVMNESPWGIVKEAFTGVGRQPISERLAAAGRLAASDPLLADAVGDRRSTSSGLSTPFGTIGATRTAPADLVPIPGHPSFKLRAAPAAAWAQFEQVYGRPIEMTGSYRSYAEQAKQYASNPNRFAPPDSSAHVRGEAVDIDLGRSGVSNPVKGDPTYDRMRAAASATGWCFSALERSAGSSKMVEPWHVSFFGCR